ncbi:hypothetical protein NM688_g2276 [Phlebia brevispora]|uniref:Uncharacterized protein n=1 Tax=Phlebia brevispora TaxID=194682 RepID=A0ACC1T9C2_9APHY|nr:hypothetical protein NM688_g2276 [Phlebia brevispora]
MQANTRVPGQPAPVKIYNAVYSSVQVYECMVRGIAVMRRRADSFVNATQILKVAGVDKGRRTKILEKEILPGKHEIVQGGYGKYQGTWIPLERGRDIAIQYGVAPLLAPLFDFVPNTNAIGALPPGLPAMGNTTTPRPLSAASSYSSLGAPPPFAPAGLAPPPIMPGSALRLLNQGRAQGLFTPSTSMLSAPRASGYVSPAPYYTGYAPFGSLPAVSPTPPPPNSQPSTSQLKRTRSDADGDVIMDWVSDPDRHLPLPSRAKVHHQTSIIPSAAIQPQVRSAYYTENGLARMPSSQPLAPTNGKAPQIEEVEEVSLETRFASKPSISRNTDLYAPLKDMKRAVIFQTLSRRDDPQAILDLLHNIPPDNKELHWDVDLVLDEQGHTALHVAASLACIETVKALIAAGADIHRGNYDGETPLIRATLATNCYDAQYFDKIVAALHSSIRTLDTSRKSVLHHIVASAGIKGRAPSARYYLEQIFYWIARHQGGEFKSLVDLQDVHGDTALNIAARVGNRSLVKTLLDVGANRSLPNKLGLRPGDFGIETEELSTGPRSDDLLSTLRAAAPGPIQKSQKLDHMIQGLANEFSAEIKAKQDALDVTQAHLRAATRELAEQRKQIHLWQTQCAELDLVAQRTRNLEKALQDEDNFDWTGRTELDGSDGAVIGGPAFQKRGSGSALAGSMDVSFNVGEEPPIPQSDAVESLIRLRRQAMWYGRVEKLMEQRLQALQGMSAEREFQCKKIVSLCTGVPIDKVEDLLEDLVIAVESESQIMDIGRVSGFLQKVTTGRVEQPRAY